LEKRKKRLLESQNGNVTTASHIGAVLEKSSMITGINYDFGVNLTLYSWPWQECCNACGAESKKEESQRSVKRKRRDGGIERKRLPQAGI
jgi:hypothetical protein